MLLEGGAPTLISELKSRHYGEDVRTGSHLSTQVIDHIEYLLGDKGSSELHKSP